MSIRYSRRSFLASAGATGAGLILGSNMLPQAIAAAKKKEAAAGDIVYSLVNKTNGKWKDDECFWMLGDHGEWHSFAKEPTAPCHGGGRIYISVGEHPKDFGDFDSYWDFVEYNAGGRTWHGNTTQVDAFCLPLTIELGDKKLGINESRSKIFELCRKEAPAEFKPIVHGDYWILSPNKAGFNKEGPHGEYFKKYVDEVWDMYATEKATPSGKYTGKVSGETLTFTPAKGGKNEKAVSCKSKPSTQDILLGEGVLASNPGFCAAFNRHVAADPGDWRNSEKFYQEFPCNWYSKFLHEHTINHKCYGFCYDDYAEQAAFFSGTGDKLIITLSWD